MFFQSPLADGFLARKKRRQSLSASFKEVALLVFAELWRNTPVKQSQQTSFVVRLNESEEDNLSDIAVKGNLKNK